LQEILKYLKEHGERLDAEIAAATGVSLEKVSLYLAELSDRGEVIMCRTTRFNEGSKTEGMLCRVSGYFPPASPGRKPKTPAA
jgi:transcription initiation factor IIE alpha subunit